MTIQKWNQVFDTIKEDSCDDCPRNSKNRSADYKVIIPRKDTSKIKYVFVSQDPAYYYINKGCPDGNAIVERFLKTCKLDDNKDKDINKERIKIDGDLKKGNVFNLVPKLLGTNYLRFNPSKDEIYWTHILKCPPLNSNDEYYRDYMGGASYCIKHLKMELQNIKSDKFCVISIGKSSMVECAKILGINLPYNSIIKNEEYQITNNSPLGSAKADWVGYKNIVQYAFIHPAARDPKSKKSLKYFEDPLFNEIRDKSW
jgi:hypothetical protein